MSTTSRVIPIPLGLVNAFLIQGEQPILVDAGLPGQEQKILNALSTHGIPPQDLSLIVITHGHTDHFGSLAALKQHCSARVAIHRADADALRQGRNTELFPAGPLGHFFRLFASERTTLPGVEPDILIEEGLDLLQEFGVNGKVLSTPGHTSGSVSIWLNTNEVIIGDMIFGGFLRRKRPNYPWFIANMAQLRASIQRILSQQPTTMYASHGGPFDPKIIANTFSLDLT